ncbi:MAG TPA: IS110 family transposase [Streptosporangiaceae bacterium]|nr:IS110 family transposase [Streptosporangiaceae bacterium]
MSTRFRLAVPAGSCGQPPESEGLFAEEMTVVEEITEEAAELVQRVAALDVGKRELTACVRVPHEDKPGRRRQEVRTYATTTRSLLDLRDWLVCQGVALCVMEATSTYWKPPFYLLEDAIGCWVVNARDVKNVPGRPKTDKLDAVWLCKLAERGMLRPSFIPPPWQRELRDLCRYRRTLIQERTREKQRAEKLLEDTQVKLSSVISDIFGKSGRDMLEALIAGQRDPHVLARMARGSMRGKISVLQEALTGQFRDHHGYLLRIMLDRVDALTAQIEALTERIDEAIAPFARQVAQLDEIPGVGKTGAQEIIAEIGVDMSRFPSADHLVSWAKFAPTARQSAGKNKPGSTGKGNPWIGGALGEAAMGAARTKTFLGSRYHRIARRRGKQRALVAVGNSILTIAYHLLADPQARFTDLGPGWHDRLAPLRRKRQLIAELERLSGQKVILQEAAA